MRSWQAVADEYNRRNGTNISLWTAKRTAEMAIEKLRRAASRGEI